jgi:hypothetical protein
MPSRVRPISYHIRPNLPGEATGRFPNRKGETKWQFEWQLTDLVVLAD